MKQTKRVLMDNELLLVDRIGVIRDTINKYGEDNFYLSFSGGKDSTILHYLIDMVVTKERHLESEEFSLLKRWVEE